MIAGLFRVFFLLALALVLLGMWLEELKDHPNRDFARMMGLDYPPKDDAA